MEIIHIILGKANPNRLNGINKVVYHLATEQTKAGKTVQVWGITPNPVHDYPERNFTTVLFQSHRFPFQVDKELKKSILEKKAAVFHFHGGWVPVFSTLANFMSRNGVRYVLTPHGAYNRIAMKRSLLMKMLYYYVFEKSFLQNARLVHLIGESEKDGLNQLNPSSATILIPYGFDSVVKAAVERSNDEFIIGFVGRLDVYTKGLDLLIEAFDQFQKIHAQSLLWIIGDGEGKSFLENEINRRKLTTAKLLGKKYGDEKDELISKMHVFAHPSRNEGLPTAVLEAASLGVASVVSVATNMAGYVEQYNAGEVTSSNNSNDLCEAFERVYQNYSIGQYSTYSNGAFQMLEKEFSWPLLVQKFDELYT